MSALSILVHLNPPNGVGGGKLDIGTAAKRRHIANLCIDRYWEDVGLSIGAKPNPLMLP